MTLRIIRREAAQRDLDVHAAFIQKGSPESAIRFLDAAREAFELLARMPEIGTRCEFPNSAIPDLRAWTIRGFTNYVVFYRPADQEVEMVRVLHAARDSAGIFEALD